MLLRFVYIGKSGSEARIALFLDRGTGSNTSHPGAEVQGGESGPPPRVTALIAYKTFVVSAIR